MKKRVEIESVIRDLTTQEKIDVLESLGKKYRRLNSERVNKNQMGNKLKVDVRPDEINMK